MNLYTVTHEHRHGVDTYLFQSSQDDLAVEYFGGLVEGHDELIPQEIDPTTAVIIAELGIDFDVDRIDESLDITKSAQPVITIEP